MKKCIKALAGFAGCFLLSATAPAQTVTPYLQAIAPTSVVVNWKTSVPLSPLVRFGTTTALGTDAAGASQSLNDVGYSNNYHYHTVKLQGLQPNTKYYYRATGGNDSSQVFSFKTLPLPGQPATADGHLRLLIMGDNQIKAQPRYDSLMVAARRKLVELYGPDYNEQLSMILNLGDQVDVGTLDHYENVHLSKSRYLSPVLPIQTAIGNHETYGTLQLQAYYNHFVLDSMQYKGIYSGTEDYYAFQAGSLVIIYLNTESGNATQFNWVKRVVDTANNDATVQWIMTIGHRPYQAEQYVGDISSWVRNTVVPYCMNSPKYLMNVGAHHHLYARGQMKDAPCYNIISGGTAWDQYWGMATEQNFDDVQKTISNWAYQIMDIDLPNNKVDVKVYSIGSIYAQKNNILIDSFHRAKGLAAPLQPQVVHDYADSVQLPLTLSASTFQSGVGEQLNSSEFQVSVIRNFSVITKSAYRHFEDLFGNAGSPDSSVDQNRNLDITKYTVPSGALGNGWHYVRVRYRDRNMEWSPWSVTDSFKVYNSVLVNPQLSLDTNLFVTGQPVPVTFTNGPTHPNAWLGIYTKGQTPGSSTPSVTWQYTNATSGVKNFTLSNPNEYFVAYFGDGGYTEVAPRKTFYYGPVPTLSINATNYALGDTVKIGYTGAPALTKDWIGVYKIGMTPGGPASIKWTYTSGAAGQYNVLGLGKGYYFATYMVRDGYREVSQRVFFSVGDTITTLTTNKSVYNLSEYISATWVDGPGLPKDWLGIFPGGSDPNVDPLLSYTYIDGLPAGTKVLPDSALPQQSGNYFLALFTNDTYDEVSNRVYFQVVNNPMDLHLLDFHGVSLGLTHLLSWKVTDENAGDRYILQHSADGKTFSDLHETLYSATSGGKYSFVNEKPSDGYNYYRLKLVSAGGMSTFSNIIRIYENRADDNTVKVFPNPVASSHRSIVESPYPIDQIDIVDAKGMMIYQSKNVSNNRFSLVHQDLPPGVYFIKVYTRKLYTLKLTVQ